MVSADRFLIDASFIIERTRQAFWGTPLITTGGCDHTFVFGFVRNLLRLGQRLGIRRGTLAIGKDAASLAGDRDFEDLMAFLREFGFPHVCDRESVGLRLVGSLSRGFSHVVTMDKRLLQLAGDGLAVLLRQPGSRQRFRCMSAEAIRSDMGIEPANVPTYLALTTGAKESRLTSRQAARLIELYGDLKAICQSIPKITSRPTRSKLASNSDAIWARYSGAICDGQTDSALAERMKSPLDLDTATGRQLLEKYGFYSLLPLLASPTDVRLEVVRGEPETDSYRAVVDKEGLRELESLVLSSGVCSVDTESDDKDPRRGTLLGVSFSAKEGEGYFLPVFADYLKDLGRNEVLSALKRMLGSEVGYVGHNIKYDQLLLRRNGIPLKSIHFDTMLAAYDCHGDWDFFNLPYLTQKLLGRTIKTFRDVVGEGETLLDLPFRDIVSYACRDADMTMRLAGVLADGLKSRGIAGQYYGETIPLLKQLCELEFGGIRVDEQGIARIRRSLLEQALCCKSHVCEQLGKNFDLDSHNDLSTILADSLGLRRFTGAKTIRTAVLEQLAISEPAVRQIVEYKRFRKQIKGLDAISSAVTDGRVFPVFSQVRSPAGMVAATQPKLFDDDAPPELRSCFDGCVHAFFSDRQRSLDTLAEVSGDLVLQRVRGSKAEADAFVAEHPLVKNLDHDRLLLSLVSGSSDARLSREFLVDQLTAGTLRHDLTRRYRGVFRWRHDFLDEARRRGYAATGRRRKYLDGLLSCDISRRTKALEHAVRWVVQF